ncbi:MFS transporter [Aliicoccus persicus]|uniref:Na+/melibiose symporter n=1 Tax=Aliicoccus persicus TaxID=930138 RepID=A0A662Z6B7_9STAP|nr:MFS transporter [Aliicoccus persicus]SEW07052.1 Na+/melibiose symporter [Aliicoccus persicus]
MIKKGIQSFIPNRRVLLLFLSQFFSNFSEATLKLTLIIAVTTLSDSTWAISGMVLIETVPYLLLAPLVGVLIDKYNRNKFIIISEILRMISIVLLIIFIQNFFLIYIFAFIYIVCSVGVNPTRNALIGSIVDEKDYTKVLAVSHNIANILVLMGFAIAGFLIALVGLEGTLFIVLISFGLSLVSLIFLSLNMSSERKEETEVTEKSETSMKQDLIEGFQFIFKSPALSNLIAIFSLAIAGFSFFNILVIDYIVNDLLYSSQQLGILETASGIGILVSTLLIGAIAKNYEKSSLFLIGLFGVSLTFILMVFRPEFFILYLVLLLLGFSFGFVQVSYSSLLMTNSSENNRGRVFTTVNSLNNVTVFVGILFASPLGTMFGSNTVLFFVGIVLLLITYYGFMRFRKISIA